MHNVSLSHASLQTQVVVKTLHGMLPSHVNTATPKSQTDVPGSSGVRDDWSLSVPAGRWSSALKSLAMCGGHGTVSVCFISSFFFASDN